MTVISHLRTIPLFAQLRENDLEELSRVAHARDYPKNSLIVSGHEALDTFYVILTGRVKSMLIAEDGREVILSIRGAGEFFGEMALFDDAPASTVIAMDDARLLQLRREDLYRIVMGAPGLALGLLRSLCNQLQEADHKIGGLILLDVPGRVCHLLIKLADQGDGVHIAKPPTHQLIGQMVGSTRESVSRALGDLAAQGVISVAHRGITIENREALELAAGQSRRVRPPQPAPAYDGIHDRRRLPQ
ncbi:MAG: Crp/Fnr family transcriptional regulator [Gemmatimonadota bacterium]|nr:Crp/Fnr family transcriptional regulator [Gemmatimonadota bacterium]MDE3128849.1 Crp/Fnr family transcriptional regulator [Gemmatimonadota bacterium]MDE3172751.1 Crp/Fnr family transcriptional regulator [Gemmatimonadota bacterium]MDE3215979.1 Crp/Fnr family transcriptional regulator [Gemmatimonadota bacterium]